LLFPWTPTLAVIPYRTSDNRRKLLLAVVVFGFVLFSAGANKLPGYLLPLIPAIAVLAGIRLAEMKDVRAVVGCSAILLLALPLIAGTLPQALAVGLSKVELTAIGWGSVLPVVAGIAIVLWFLRREKRSLAIATTVLTATIAVAYLKWRMFPELDSVVSARALWLQIRDSRDEYCMGILDRDIRYGLNYYAHKPLKECSEWPLLKRLDR